MDDIKPTCQWPLLEAIEELTGCEIIAIEREFKCHVESLSQHQTIIGVVWAFENREHERTWAEIKSLRRKELTGYFQPEPKDDEDPLSEESLDSKEPDEN